MATVNAIQNQQNPSETGILKKIDDAVFDFTASISSLFKSCSQGDVSGAFDSGLRNVTAQAFIVYAIPTVVRATGIALSILSNTFGDLAVIRLVKSAVFTTTTGMLGVAVNISTCILETVFAVKEMIFLSYLSETDMNNEESLKKAVQFLQGLGDTYLEHRLTPSLRKMIKELPADGSIDRAKAWTIVQAAKHIAFNKMCINIIVAIAAAVAVVAFFAAFAGAPPLAPMIIMLIAGVVQLAKPILTKYCVTNLEANYFKSLAEPPAGEPTV